MNKKILLLVMFIALLSLSVVAEKKVEDSNYKIECDKPSYRTIGGNFFAYCDVTNFKTTQNLDIKIVLERSDNVIVKDIKYMNSTNEYAPLDDYSMSITREKERKGVLKLLEWLIGPERDEWKGKAFGARLSKSAEIKLEINFYADSSTSLDEFWIIVEGNNYLELDPAVSGCVDNGTDTVCADDTFQGDFILTSNNIIIRNATIDGDPGNNNDGIVNLTSTAGFISIIDSFVDGHGGPITGNQGGNDGTLYMQAAGDIIMINSQGDGGGSDGSTNTNAGGGDGHLTIITPAKFEMMNSSLNGNGGRANGQPLSGSSTLNIDADIINWVDSDVTSTPGSQFGTVSGASGGAGRNSVCNIFSKSFVGIRTDFDCKGGKGGNRGPPNSLGGTGGSAIVLLSSSELFAWVDGEIDARGGDAGNSQSVTSGGSGNLDILSPRIILLNATTLTRGGSFSSAGNNGVSNLVFQGGQITLTDSDIDNTRGSLSTNKIELNSTSPILTILGTTFFRDDTNVLCVSPNLQVNKDEILSTNLTIDSSCDDVTFPVINLSVPTPPDGQVQFLGETTTFTTTVNSDINATCNLIVDGAITNSTDLTLPIVDEVVSFSLVFMELAEHDYLFACNGVPSIVQGFALEPLGFEIESFTITNESEINQKVVNFNATVNAANDFTCDINGFANVTQNSLNFLGGIRVPVSFEVTMPAANGLITYDITCDDTINPTITTGDTVILFDDVAPTFTSAIFADGQIIVSSQNITGEFDIQDNIALDSFRAFVDDVLVKFVTNITNTSTIIELNEDISPFGSGEHDLRIQISDGLFGDLNFAELNFTFFTIAVSESFPTPILNGDLSIYNLTIEGLNGSLPTAFMNFNNVENLSAIAVFFNGTTSTHQVEKIVIVGGVTGTIDHQWFFNFNGSLTSLPVAQQTVVSATINLCGVGNNTFPIANLTYFDEVDNTPINLTNALNLDFAIGQSSLELTTALPLNQSQSICTNVDPSEANLTFGMSGQMTLNSPPIYVTRIFDIAPGTPISLNNSEVTQLPLFLIKLNESQTVTYTWFTNLFEAVNGEMEVLRCNVDGTQSLVESIPVVDGKGVANIQLLTQPYAYNVIIDGNRFIEPNGFSRCHIESSTSVTLQVNIAPLDTSKDIGVNFISCSVKQVAPNTVQLDFGFNPEDDSTIEGCIVAYRRSNLGTQRVFENCTTTQNTITRNIPVNSFSYVVNGEIRQRGLTKTCQDVVIFSQGNTTAEQFGLTGILAIVLLIMSMSLFYAGNGEGQLIGAGVGLIMAFSFGIVNWEWEIVMAVISFLLFVVVIGRYTRK